jgi:amino acid adenylation domain-containing protein/FkbH-like protein/thioester reductase-like protein
MLMNYETLTDARLVNHSRENDDSMVVPSSGFDDASSVSGGTQSIVIAATFTADLLRRPLQFWMERLRISSDVSLAPYGQIMQELMDPQSAFSRNRMGFNVLLIRVEDWIRDRLEKGIEMNITHVRRVAAELVVTMSVRRGGGTAPMLVFFGPDSSSLPPVYHQPLQQIRHELVNKLAALKNVHVVEHADLVHLYRVEEFEDARSDEIAHIPYTNEYFVALATLLARRITAQVKPQYKVIAIDCDNTLWKGVCGEDGPAGIELTPAHLEFQRMLIRQHDAGVLLCLCTKNNPSDVEAVFNERSEMPLREDHLVCSRINWDSKSANLASIAQELDLSLDSFIFVDDSLLECAEVRDRCPAVLTLQMPQSASEIEHFVHHIWAFDRVNVTNEAKQRTSQYRQNRARYQAQQQASDLEQFLASLELQVDIAEMKPAELDRVAELTLRTNQFNLTTIRRRAPEIFAQLGSANLQCLTVHVRDRFGDYGLVGVLLLQRDPDALEVDTFLLSCRVLGRRVEHRIINELGRIAQQEGRASIGLRYRRTARNEPAWSFLTKSFSGFLVSPPDISDPAAEYAFRIPAQFALSVGSAAVAGNAWSDSSEAVRSAPSPSAVRSSAEWCELAYRLSHISELMKALIPAARQPRSAGSDAAHGTTIDQAVLGIFAEVLGLDGVDVQGDFFDLGGDSLQAVQVIARIGSSLRLELSLHEFLEAPTVEGVVARLAQASHASETIPCVTRSKPIPLSWAQQRLWFIGQLEGGTAAYDIPLALRVRGTLDHCALQVALDGLIVRHEALRTTFIKPAGEPVQRISPSGSFALLYVDLRKYSLSAREAEVRRELAEELSIPFDLEAGPLIRGRVLQVADEEHVLFIVMNHMVSDGWSIGILIRELGALYEAGRNAQADPLPPLPIQYADYAQWQREWLSGAALAGQIEYWKGHLSGAPNLLELPTDRPRPPVQSYRGASQSVCLGPQLTADLKAYARRFNVTLAMTLCTAWATLLSRLSNQDDVVIGMPVANRQRTELEGLIGYFVNTLAVRMRFDSAMLVADLTQHVKQVLLSAYEHQDAPFEQVVEALQPTRSLSHSPVFQVMFVLHNAPHSVLQLPGLTLVEEDVPLQTAQFDLLLALQESEHGIGGSLNYATDLFDAQTIARWINYFEVVVREMVRDPQMPVSKLDLMSQTERHATLHLFNSTQAPYPREKLVHELFEEQVVRTPLAVAVAHEGQSLTYLELDRKANQLAAYLAEKGVGANELVALYVERGLDMVVGLLGILKSGAAYIPLDPSFPLERLSYMLKDSAPRVLLTQGRLKTALPETTAETLAIDEEWHRIEQTPVHAARSATAATRPRSQQLAYVIYTSGSTGNPKGVMVEHSAVVNFLISMRNHPGISAADCMLAITTMSFDIAALEIYLPLITGAKVVVASREAAVDARELTALIDRHQVTVMQATPATWRLLLTGGWNGRSNLKILCGGEALTAELAAELVKRSSAVWNLYGPTETTIWSCARHVATAAVHGSIESIGRPIANTQIYILDDQRQPVPIGVLGEIYIGGAGVARGYLNRRSLTEERFVSDRFGSSESCGRIYKTGDLGRWRADGNVEYLGRNDDQVKIHGFRIELGEIEAQLVRHAAIREAVAVAREDVAGEKRLVAYVVTRDGVAMPTVEQLRTHLKAALPEYMVPSAIVTVERMPLTPNGKVNRRALPAPELDAYVKQQYEVPEGEVEEVLAGIWEQLLRVNRVGRRDNFFELGGHSLLIVQMMERLRAVGLSIEVRRVFQTPRLCDLAGLLTNEATEQFPVPPNLIPAGCEAITPQMLPMVELAPEEIDLIVRATRGGAANIQDIYPLAPLQEGILFHHLLDGDGSDAYVLATVLSVASRERLDELIDALQSVIDRHDVLRTAVLWEQLPRPVQVVSRHASLPVHEVVLDAERDGLAQVKEWLKPEHQRLNLQQAPLMRLQIAQDLPTEQWYALLQLHHIIGDNTSQEIVMSEVVALLDGRVNVFPNSVPYRNHVAQSLAYGRLHDAEAFFRSKLADVDEPTTPFGLLDVYGDGTQIEEAHIELAPKLAKRVREQARRAGVSTATLFHAAWGLVVAHTSARDDVVFGSVLLGRLQGNSGAQRILGMFINTLPLRLQLRDVTARALVDHTQRELVELLSHEQASLAVAQRCSGVAGSAPLFSALLNYRHSIPKPEAQWSSTEGITVLASLERTNYPLALTVDDLGEGFALSAQTDKRLDPARVTRFLQTATESLIAALEQAPETPALALAILPENERRQVLDTFNATQQAYPHNELIHELLERRAQSTPDSVALIHEDQNLTYGELNRRANQVAHTLLQLGVRPDKLVGVYVERGPEMVIGLLGILKAGGAYVPIDVSYPAERVAYMIRDSAPVVVLTQARLMSALRDSEVRLLALDASNSAMQRAPDTNPRVTQLGLQSRHLAYVIYTSGSTGAPKGVMVEHRNLMNLVHWSCRAFHLDATSTCSSTASVGFDAATWEIWPPLCIGAKLMLAPAGINSDPERLLSWWMQQPLDVSFLATPMAEFALSHGFHHPRLRMLLVGGDRLRYRPTGGDCRLINNYGPTETTVVATSGLIQPDEQVLHIGRPIDNTRIYILGSQQLPVPVGVAGEVHIGGASVARGYLNQPELTLQRFLRDPFSTDSKARMYRTGDLARWRPDGTIEYVGRNDHQIKIRGFRIELGEIEAQLARHACVKDVVVIAREPVAGEKSLVAYVVLDQQPGDGDVPNVEALRAHVQATLPDYMVPSAFVMLAAMPLTPNGKVDRRALPEPELDAYVRRQYEAPQGEVEEILANIWQDLLGLERVGRLDNFFELGGHSLLIVQMKERLRRVGLSVEVRRVFDSPTLAELAGMLSNESVTQASVPPNLIPPGCREITPQMLPLVDLAAEHIASIVAAVPGGAPNIQDIYPLAPLQEGILFHHLFNSDASDSYILANVLRVSSRERLEELIAAFQEVINHHDVLRTAVLWEQLPRPVQVVYRQATLPVKEVRLAADRDPIEQINEWLEPERQRVDLRRAPLLCLQVAADIHTEQWYVLLQLHHITCDHVTFEIVISEIVARLSKRAATIPESVPYRNHVGQALVYAKMNDAEAFFRGKLQGVNEVTAPFGLVDVHGDGADVEEAHAEFESQLAQRVRMQARRLGVSAATLFHAAWGLVVAHTSGRDDIVYGSVLLGRLLGTAGAQRILGMFINTLPLRLRLQDLTARELVERTQRELVQLIGHEQASLAVAQRCSDIDGSSPLFTSLLNYRHSAPDSLSQWSGADGVRLLAMRERTNYPITVSVDDFGQKFAVSVQTDRRIQPDRVVGYLCAAMTSLVDSLEGASQARVLSLSILPERERLQVLELFNETRTVLADEPVISRLFEAQVRRTPQRLAVIHNGESLSYAQVNAKANQLARYLLAQGVGPDRLVGVCLERSLDMIVGLLAILKAGAAYMPLDPDYPAERLEYMLRDAAPQFVLTKKSVPGALPITPETNIDLAERMPQLAGYPDQDLSPAEATLSPSNLVYVIYTSGSTGRPKGAAMTHRSMVNLVEWHRSGACGGEEQRVLQFAALSFDVAFQEIFSTVCTGSTLVLLDDCIRRDATALLELLGEQAIGRLFVPPLMLQALAECFSPDDSNLESLRDVITAGEQLRISPEIAAFFTYHENCRLHNHYGPTETHVVTTRALTGSPQAWPTLPPIGRPIWNTRIYILDDSRHPVPVGVAGEVYIGGVGVARGYLGRPELTAQRFAADRFAESAARVYRTGDVARWLNDGTIEYLGRNDDQVKIRGFRIELAEIETQLALHPHVHEAAVIAREDIPGEKRLVAYITVADDGAPGVDELRMYLKGLLPAYMMPSAFVLLETLPLTPSGKLDRRALPAPESDAYVSLHHEPAQGAVEEQLAAIWQQVLAVERVGRHDNFFELGGHSLLALKALLRINQSLNMTLRVVDIYQNPTIQELAARVVAKTVKDPLVDLAAEAHLDEDIVALSGQPAVPAKTIMLTGATGFVGRFLLAQLLQDTDAVIYCLVRAESEREASSRLRATLVKWGLWRDEFKGRLATIPGDLRLPRLGIKQATYDWLSENVDSIYHCGTSMNHLETYAMAKPANVEASRQLLRLATTARPKVINYISTLGIFDSAADEGARIVHEDSRIEQEKHSHSQGYAASKWVAEKIFITASERGIPCNIFRLGLVWADTEKGRFDELQSVDRVLKSCLMSGYGIEGYRYPMPPTPVDYVARSIVFLASRHSDGRGIFHISSSEQALEDVFRECGEMVGLPLDLLPYYDWICEIKRLHLDGRSLPAIPIVEFAFSMDEAEFHRHERSVRSAANISFDCTRSHLELESGGIVAPSLNRELLKVTLEDMCSRGADVRQLLSWRKMNVPYADPTTENQRI